NLSEITPTQGPKIKNGICAKKATIPRDVALCVNSQTTHAWAVCCIQSPSRLKDWPNIYTRILFIRRVEKLSPSACNPEKNLLPAFTFMETQIYQMKERRDTEGLLQIME